jgi:hypothetical protein
MTFSIPDPYGMPDAVQTASGNLAQSQLMTTDNVIWLLDALHIKLRYNTMTHTFVLMHTEFTDTPLGQSKAYLLVCDMLTRMRIKGQDKLGDMLTVLAMDTDPFHPMGDWVGSAAWDGVDRFAALLATVPTSTELWPVYLRKWMIEICEGIFGWVDEKERSLSQVLVFCGGQGMGKGRWLRNLTPGYTLADAELHLGSSTAKDHMLQTLQYPVVELGELDSTFRKSDVSALKSFISRPTDMIRAPYAKIAHKRLRNTCFVGTVNSMEFLGDPTGSRRFWPIEIEGKLNWDHGLDLQQLWAQAATWWDTGEDYMLSELDEKRRIKSAVGFTMVTPEEDILDGHWVNFCHDTDSFAALNKTEIMGVCGVNHRNIAAAANVGAWLLNKLGKPRKITISGVRKDNSWLWPVPVAARSQKMLMVERSLVLKEVLSNVKYLDVTRKPEKE